MTLDIQRVLAQQQLAQRRVGRGAPDEVGHQVGVAARRLLLHQRHALVQAWCCTLDADAILAGESMAPASFSRSSGA